MPVELHERLSEFSYGYGVTREVERELRSQELSATPFLPSLLHEAKLGFDVGFKRVGAPLLLQFKLGQAMRRFVPAPRPKKLNKLFWRYTINTAEPDGQFELLLKAEKDGAEVYYFAPKFHDWEIYLEIFECKQILSKSLIIKPSEIRRVMTKNKIPDAKHRIVYSGSKSYLCSDPIEVEAVDASRLMEDVRGRIERGRALGDVLQHIYDGFSRRSEIRRPRETGTEEDPDRIAYSIPSDLGSQVELRRQRLTRLRSSGYTEEQAVALSVGAEAWSSGAQLVFVTESAA
jgi:hypothetical protein